MIATAARTPAPAPESLSRVFPGVTPRPSGDFAAVNVPVADLHGVVKHLRDAEGFDMLVDVTAVDWGVDARPRFSVVHHLFSTSTHAYLRLVADLADADVPVAPSVADLHPGANWHERETWDMFGIRFAGHPDLRRILMWEGYPYFPLRKEFPLAGEETELPAPDVVEATGVGVIPAPMMGGPFHADAGRPMSEAEPRAADQSWTEAKPKPAAPGAL